jgi:signal transduction histidine kinase
VESTLGIEAALRGEHGSLLYRNLLGVSVMGNFRWLEDRQVALIVEVGQREALAPAWRLGAQISLYGLLFSVVVAVVIRLLARGIVRPILGVRTASLQLAAGDLSARAPVLTKDEIGDLARAFNLMADNIAQSNQAIRTSEERHRNIFQTTLASIWEEDYSLLMARLDDLRATGVVDMRRYLEENPAFLREAARLIRVTDVNETTLAMYEAASKEEIFAGAERIVTPDGHCALREQLIALESGERTFQTETVAQTLTGKRIDVLMRVRFQRESQTALVTMLDITERRRMEREASRLVVELVGKSGELERVASAVSRELRVPLETIGSLIGEIRRAGEGNGDSDRGRLAEATKAARRMAGVLDALLDFSRIGRLVTATEPVDIGAVIRQAVEAAADDRQAASGIRIEETLPTVLGDHLRLRELFRELVTNALRCTRTQSAPRVEIGVLPGEEEDEVAVFYVRDNGVGVDAAHIERVFDLFETLEPEGAHLGAGLALARRIVEVHGGRIWVESAGPGFGATFYFSLPLAAA